MLGRAAISLRLGVRLEHPDDADAGGNQAQAGDDEDHENAEQIAPEIKLAGADEPAHFRGRCGFPADEMHDKGKEEEHKAGAHRADGVARSVLPLHAADGDPAALLRSRHQYSLLIYRST